MRVVVDFDLCESNALCMAAAQVYIAALLLFGAGMGVHLAFDPR